jgi:hypothetical protein
LGRRLLFVAPESEESWAWLGGTDENGLAGFNRRRRMMSWAVAVVEEESDDFNILVAVLFCSDNYGLLVLMTMMIYKWNCLTIYQLV